MASVARARHGAGVTGAAPPTRRTRRIVRGRNSNLIDGRGNRVTIPSVAQQGLRPGCTTPSSPGHAAPEGTPRTMAIEFVLNGATQRVEPRPGETFLETLRERCGITSLKDGCSPQGQCGCCVALVDGLPKTTCAMPARVADGKHIVTLDGLPADERKQIADSFAAAAGLQCGFCIPGIALRAKAITDRDPSADARCDRARARRAPVPLHRLREDHRRDRAARGGQARRADPAGVHRRTRRPAAGARSRAAQTTLGERPFVDDLAVPGMLHGALVLSPHPRARVMRIDTARARALPGVHRGRDRRRRTRRALVRPALQRLAGFRRRGRRGALRRRRARRRRGGRPPHGARRRRSSST